MLCNSFYSLSIFLVIPKVYVTFFMYIFLYIITLAVLKHQFVLFD